MEYSIHYDEHGISQISKSDEQEGSVRILWTEITDVVAFKKDCFTVDQIRILIGSQNQKKWIEITEDDQGFENLIDHLPGCLSTGYWMEEVMFPPFVPQTKVLFHQPEAEIA
jgi:hypothetical protein